MADNINNRIIASGLGEIERGFAAAGNSAEQSGNRIRAALVGAISSTNQFNAATQNTGASAAATRYAIQNLTFQINDVATSLASGISPFRTFTQQAGQFVQLFQQGGGVGNVLRGFGERLAALVTPTNAAVAGIAALAGGFVFLVERAASAESATRQFNVTLQGMHRNTQVTGEQLEKIAESFKDIGISAAEGRKHVLEFIQAGGDPRRAEQAVRVAKDVQAVLGTSIEEFLNAAAKGGPALEEFAKRLGLITGLSKELRAQFDAAAESSVRFRQAIQGAFIEQNKALRDLTRSETRAQEDRDRAKRQAFLGLEQAQIQEQEREIAHARAVEDINRESAIRINTIIRERNEENRKQLAAYNKQVEDEAKEALDRDNGLLSQIGQAVSGASTKVLSPFQQSIRDINVAWTELLDTMSQSEVITQVIKDITELIKSIRDAIKWIDELSKSFNKTPALPQFLGGPGEPTAPVQSNAAGGLIRGPGTGTSDSILSRVSNGEFVVNAMATRMNLPLLQAINSMRTPRVSGPTRGFAMGGLVTPPSAPAGTPVNIYLGGNVYSLSGERNVVTALTQAARKSSLLSAGRKPSTA